MSALLSSFWGFFFACSPLLSAPADSPSRQLTVAAAADLSPLQTDLLAAFRKIEPNLQLRFVIAASASLAQQIENGAPYDVFLSANAQYVDRLASSRKIEPNSVLIYASGRVGILWKDGKHHDLKDLQADWVRSVAVPNPKLAPYGTAAVEALQHAGLWDSVRKKVVYGENVRQTFQIFDSGNADAVLTSATLLEGKPADLIPVDWHSPIRQKAGVIAASPNLTDAREFVRKLTSPEIQTVFTHHGLARPLPSN